MLIWYQIAAIVAFLAHSLWVLLFVVGQGQDVNGKRVIEAIALGSLMMLTFLAGGRT